jgi:hypothetical protein
MVDSNGACPLHERLAHREHCPVATSALSPARRSGLLLVGTEVAMSWRPQPRGGAALLRGHLQVQEVHEGLRRGGEGEGGEESELRSGS